MTPKKFTKVRMDKNDHSWQFKAGDWIDYWTALSEPERQSLRDKAKWECKSLSAVAIEWGAVEQQENVDAK